jgi:hypothetical protein
VIALVLMLAVLVGFWLLWTRGGDNRRFYRAMGWTAWWVVGKDKP